MSRPSASGPAWRSVLLAAMLVLAPGGAGPAAGLAEEAAWWEAHSRADVDGDADLLGVTLWSVEGEATQMVGVPELGPARFGAVTGLVLGLGGCGSCPPSTFPRGRYENTESDEAWLIGATAEMAVSVLVLPYTDEAGATYRVTFE